MCIVLRVVITFEEIFALEQLLDNNLRDLFSEAAQLQKRGCRQDTAEATRLLNSAVVSRITLFN